MIAKRLPIDHAKSKCSALVQDFGRADFRLPVLDFADSKKRQAEEPAWQLNFGPASG
jgi:hypothetical protein